MNYNQNKGGGYDRSKGNYSNTQSRERPSVKDWASDFNPEWISKGIDENTIDFLDRFGADLAKGRENEKLTSSQFRNIYNELKRIQLKGLKTEKSSFLMLRPKLAYAQGRHGDQRYKSYGIDKFKRVFDKALSEIHINTDTDENLTQSTERFKNFMYCMEALIAYHKAHGGK